MAANTESQIDNYEQALLRIVRSLPPERIVEIVDFARFIQLQFIAQDEDFSEAEVLADEEKWDSLLARPEAQKLLEDMADQALAEFEAGLAGPMIFTEDGDIAPG